MLGNEQVGGWFLSGSFPHSLLRTQHSQSDSFLAISARLFEGGLVWVTHCLHCLTWQAAHLKGEAKAGGFRDLQGSPSRKREPLVGSVRPFSTPPPFPPLGGTSKETWREKQTCLAVPCGRTHGTNPCPFTRLQWRGPGAQATCLQILQITNNY